MTNVKKKNEHKDFYERIHILLVIKALVVHGMYKSPVSKVRMVVCMLTVMGVRARLEITPSAPIVVIVFIITAVNLFVGVQSIQSYSICHGSDRHAAGTTTSAAHYNTGIS